MESNERLRTLKNSFVSGTFSLFSSDDIKTICGLFVRTSGLSASASAKSSDVWQYFGPLYLKVSVPPGGSTSAGIDSGATSSASTSMVPAAAHTSSSTGSTRQLNSPLLVDDSKNYCCICLNDVQSSTNTGHGSAKAIKMTKLTRYSLNTATSAMRLHLHEAHGKSMTQSKGVRSKEHLRPAGDFFAKVARTSAKGNFNKDLVTWLALDLLPFSTVANEGFRHFFQQQFPHIHLPSESNLRLTVLQEVYTELHEKVARELASVSTICLMFDGWTDRHNAHHFLGIRACYIREDWTSGTVTISCKPSPQDARGVSEHVMNELGKFGLTQESFVKDNRILFTTHDGASAMVKTSTLLKTSHFQHCSSHALHLLVMNDAMNRIPDLKELIRRCKDVVTKLHFKADIVQEEMEKLQNAKVVHGIIAKVEAAFEILECEENIPLDDPDTDEDDEIEAAEEQTHSKTSSAASTLATFAIGTGTTHLKHYRRLRQEVITRWNSVLQMMSSLLSLREEVNEALKRTGHYDLCIRATEWNIISQLCTLLETFQSLTDVASGNFVGLSVVPLIRAKVKSACEVNTSDCDEIQQFKRKILANVDKRFPITDAVKLATLLDPASKNKKFVEMTLDQKRDLLLSAVASMQVSTGYHAHQSATEEADSTTEAAATKRLRLMDEFDDDDEASEREGELMSSVMQYLSPTEKPAADERNNPLMYWKNSKFVSLAPLARRYLTISSSSVPVESMFSVTGMLMNGRRSSLAPHTMNKLTFIHDNFLAFKSETV